MIQTHTSPPQTLTLLAAKGNRALQEILQNSSSQELQPLSSGKSLETLLQNLFDETLQENTQNKAILKLLQNNPTLKSLGHLQDNIKELYHSLEKNSPLSKTLNSFLQTIDSLTSQELTQKLQNSGIFLESKLKNEEHLQNDFKALLLQAQSEIHDPKTLKHIDKLLLQIDYYQLSSYLANTPTLFIPYQWDLLENGHLRIQRTQKQQTICDIELTLKTYGTLKLRLGLFEHNQLYITINTQSEQLTTLLQTHIQELKKQLIKIHLIPKEISFVQEKETPYHTNTPEFSSGFEVNV